MFIIIDSMGKISSTSGQNIRVFEMKEINLSLKMEGKKFDLEDRLVNYTCRVIDVVESLPNTRAGNYIAGQLIRCCQSPAFNYSEAQAASSKTDFIHKMQIVFKELKECRTALKIIRKKEMIRPVEKLDDICGETEELIAIIGKSLVTANKNRKSTPVENRKIVH
jgi:four helix bundle protein